MILFQISKITKSRSCSYAYMIFRFKISDSTITYDNESISRLKLAVSLSHIFLIALSYFLLAPNTSSITLILTFYLSKLWLEIWIFVLPNRTLFKKKVSHNVLLFFVSRYLCYYSINDLFLFINIPIWCIYEADKTFTKPIIFLCNIFATYSHLYA